MMIITMIIMLTMIMIMHNDDDDGDYVLLTASRPSNHRCSLLGVLLRSLVVSLHVALAASLHHNP